MIFFLMRYVYFDMIVNKRRYVPFAKLLSVGGGFLGGVDETVCSTVSGPEQRFPGTGG
jgi:hypothetical protein